MVLKLETLWSKILKDDLPAMAAALAFFTILSLAPLTLITLLIWGNLPLDLSSHLFNLVSYTLSPETSELMKMAAIRLKSIDLQSLSGIFTGSIFLVAGSAVFAQIQSSLNRIWQVNDLPLKKILKKRALCIVFVFIAAIALWAAAVATTITQLLLTKFVFLSFMVPFAVALLTILFITGFFYWLPDTRVRLHAAFLASLLTYLFLMTGKVAFEFYVKTTELGSLYGTTSLLFVSLLWLYYSALILFFGAEISYHLHHRRA